MRKFLELCLFIVNQIIESTKKKIAILDNERLAIALVSIIGIGLLLPLLIVAPGLFESEWFLNLIIVPAEYGSFIADGAYLGRLWNLFTARPYGEKTQVKTFLNNDVIIGRQIGYAEKLFTPIGMFLGISLAIFCIALHAVVPFLGVFSYFAYILFILAYACNLGGLFNRLASSFDGTRLTQEKKAILSGVVLGLMIALGLFAVMLTGTMPFITVIGISKVFVDLLLLHKLLFALPFILSLTSLTTSFFDYFAKAYCFLIYSLGYSDVHVVNERIKSRSDEYKGAFLGISVGCLLALGIIAGLVFTGNLTATPIAIAATIFVTIVVCNNVLASLFSRIGRLLDGIKRIYKVSDAQSQSENLVNFDAPLMTKLRGSVFLPSLIDKTNFLIDKDYNDNKNDNKANCLYGLRRIQSYPTFFSTYKKEQNQVSDDKVFCENTLFTFES